MIINRNNYEAFFLMYVDDELSATDRKQVESFVKENPDLEAELRTLRAAIVKPENHLFFEGKESLLKREENPAENLEELLLLYTDGELDEQSKLRMEKAIEHDPLFLRQLESFLQTRAQPDPGIVFEGKEFLYKKEKDKNVWLFRSLRLTAAAMLLWAAGFVVWKTLIAPAGRSIAAVHPVLPVSPAVEGKKIQVPVTQALPDSLYHERTADNGASTARKNAVPKQSSKTMDRIPSLTRSKEEDPNTSLVNGQRGAFPKKSRVSLAIDNPVKTVGLPGSVPLNDLSFETLRLPSLVKAPENQMINGRPIQKIKSLGTEPTADPEDGFYAMNTAEKKNKMRGIFRKVSRVFEKTTNVDGGNKRSLLIGSFQIALK